MQIKKIKGFDMILGESQGYSGLPVRITKTFDPVSQRTVIQLETEWKPSTEELALLNQGKSIIVSLYSPVHPPIMLTVGDTASN